MADNLVGPGSPGPVAILVHSSHTQHQPSVPGSCFTSYTADNHTCAGGPMGLPAHAPKDYTADNPNNPGPTGPVHNDDGEGRFQAAGTGPIGQVPVADGHDVVAGTTIPCRQYIHKRPDLKIMIINITSLTRINKEWLLGLSHQADIILIQEHHLLNRAHMQLFKQHYYLTFSAAQPTVKYNGKQHSTGGVAILTHKKLTRVWHPGVPYRGRNWCANTIRLAKDNDINIITSYLPHGRDLGVSTTLAQIHKFIQLSSANPATALWIGSLVCWMFGCFVRPQFVPPSWVQVGLKIDQKSIKIKIKI